MIYLESLEALPLMGSEVDSNESLWYNAEAD